MSQQQLTESNMTAKQQMVHRQLSSAAARPPQNGFHSAILQLQRTLGNHRVAQLIQAKRITPEGKIVGIQRKLTVGAADDQYEQEADRVAHQVMSIPDAVSTNSMQRAPSPEEDKDKMQTKPLAASISPFVLRQLDSYEKLDDKKAQSAKTQNGSFDAGADFEAQVSLSKGRGSPLPDNVRSFMEPRFGVDFNHVRVHTGSDAIQMNRDVSAQAFTHGSDIYFGAGSDSTNLELTAHELTHVVQQTGGGTRSEDGEDGETMDGGEPDWSAPIEQEADTRSEAFSVQRHHGEETVPGFRAKLGPTAVQRQAVPAPAAFPTFPQVRWNATVSNAMWGAWAQTLRAATTTTRREQGFWVQWDNTTTRNANGDMRVVGAVTAPPIGPTITASVQLGARPADVGNWVTVASFHTHTPTRFRPVGRVVGPSGADHTADTNDNVTGLVFDYTAVAGGAIPAGHPTWSDAQVYHSGPNSRV